MRNLPSVGHHGDGETPCRSGSTLAVSLPPRRADLLGRGTEQGGGGEGGVAGQAGLAVVGPGGQEIVGGTKKSAWKRTAFRGIVPVQHDAEAQSKGQV